MSQNQVNPYNLDEHIAELYDQQENYDDDVRLLLDLIADQGTWNIFEPFCGTGRILLPLVKAGHHLIGLDQSSMLLDICRRKLCSINSQATLLEGDAMEIPWPADSNLVILGGNCLYELANAHEQEKCIHAAAQALKPGGFLFLDNDHMEGDLALAWQNTQPRTSFPSGICVDGTHLESTMQTIWFDVAQRLVRFERKTKITFPDGEFMERAYIQQKHPVSTQEMTLWLDQNGFAVKQMWGYRSGQPYTDSSPRAIFWAQKR